MTGGGRTQGGQSPVHGGDSGFLRSAARGISARRIPASVTASHEAAFGSHDTGRDQAGIAMGREGVLARLSQP
ncbi:hypothetical protein GCM10023238_01700 [Streptomyces heliomycini]